jgi:uncharacterized protein YjbI with pentapeptide repeats
MSTTLKPTPEQLQEILALHRKWWNGEEGGVRANLHDADLYDANLHGANLCGANLYAANLHGANLRGANLYAANLHGANLRDADLRGASLYGANLRDANLHDADLYAANLHDDTILSDGVVWKSYVDELVPALLQAGGRSLDEMAQPRIWDCHRWENCPMAEAFGVHELSNIPVLYRAPANLFIQFFDARVAPLNDLSTLRQRWNLAPLSAEDAASCEVAR